MFTYIKSIKARIISTVKNSTSNIPLEGLFHFSQIYLSKTKGNL